MVMVVSWGQIIHFELSLDASSLMSDVISSIKILSLVGAGEALPEEARLCTSRRQAGPSPLNLESETRNPKPETRNPKPETRNLRHETRNPKLEISATVAVRHRITFWYESRSVSSMPQNLFMLIDISDPGR